LSEAAGTGSEQNRSAALLIMPRIKWTRDRILLEIRRLHGRGEDLSVRHLRSVGLGGMVTTAYRLFGTWREAISEAGVEPQVLRPRLWSVDRILSDIRRLAAEGRDMSYAAMRVSAPRLVTAACRNPQLGNWTRALEAAGVAASRHARRGAWTAQRIVDGIQEMVARKEPLAFGDARREQPKLVRAACDPRHFGSWGAAVRAAGVDYDECRKRREWTRERVLATIKHLHEGGVPLTTTGVRRSGWSCLVEAARKPAMFGNWREAVECAGIDYEEQRRLSLAAAREVKVRGDQ
jgi:hypothetical protein